jgi:hypothetical protein
MVVGTPAPRLLPVGVSITVPPSSDMADQVRVPVPIFFTVSMALTVPPQLNEADDGVTDKVGGTGVFVGVGVFDGSGIIVAVLVVVGVGISVGVSVAGISCVGVAVVRAVGVPLPGKRPEAKAAPPQIASSATAAINARVSMRRPGLPPPPPPPRG